MIKIGLKIIFLIHGEPKALETLKMHLNEAGFKNSIVVEPFKTYELY